MRLRRGGSQFGERTVCGVQRVRAFGVAWGSGECMLCVPSASAARGPEGPGSDSTVGHGRVLRWPAPGEKGAFWGGHTYLSIPPYLPERKIEGPYLPEIKIERPYLPERKIERPYLPERKIEGLKLFQFRHTYLKNPPYLPEEELLTCEV